LTVFPSTTLYQIYHNGESTFHNPIGAFRRKAVYKNERKSNSESASSERKRVAEDLKSAITAAREAYKQAKTSLDTSYEEIYQREFENIASEYASKKKKKNKKK